MLCTHTKLNNVCIGGNDIGNKDKLHTVQTPMSVKKQTGNFISQVKNTWDHYYPSWITIFQTTRSHHVSITILKRSIYSPLRQTIRLQIWNVWLFSASFWSIGPKRVLYLSVCRVSGGNFPEATNPAINSFLIISQITPITLDQCGRMTSD